MTTDDLLLSDPEKTARITAFLAKHDYRHHDPDRLAVVSYEPFVCGTRESYSIVPNAASPGDGRISREEADRIAREYPTLVITTRYDAAGEVRTGIEFEEIEP